MKPKRVVVCGKTFKIIYADKWPGMEADDVGETDPVKQVIYIKNGQSLEAEQDTLLHEYFEAAGMLMGFGKDHNLIIRVTTATHQLFKNKSLVTYLKR